MRSPISRPSAPPKAPANLILERALEAHSQNNLSKAEDLYRQFLEIEPDDARALHNLGVIGLQTGHPAAAVELIRSSLKKDTCSVDGYCNLGLALKRAGDPNAAEQAYRKAIQIDPMVVEAHVNLGVLLRELQRSDDAREAFLTAISLTPKDGAIWSNLGILELQANRADKAIEHFREASRLEPDNPQILGNLAGALAEVQEYGEALEILQRAVDLDTSSAEVFYNIGRCHYALGSVSLAIANYRKAIELDLGFAAAHHNLAHALLADGQLEEGWREYRWRWKSAHYHDTRTVPDVPLWAGQELEGKSLLVWSEQGVGDKLLFAGLLPEICSAGGSVTLETEQRLVPLFRRSFTNIGVTTELSRDEGYDYQIPMGDLPRLYRSSIDTFSSSKTYLVPDAQLVEALKIRYRNKNGFVLGISWASRPPKGIELTELSPLLQLPGVQAVNLQYGDHAAEISALEQKGGCRILTDDQINPLDNIDAFVSQVAAMDAVVTIQNTTLYAAGGLGIPTFAILPPVPDWRWLGQEKLSPWHECVHLYHREGADAAGPLEAIVSNICGQIRSLISEHEAGH